MNQPIHTRTVQLGTYTSIEEILEEKRHNGFWIGEGVVPALRQYAPSKTQIEVDLFCAPDYELTGESVASVEKVYEAIVAKGYMLCTAEMAALAYPLEPRVKFYGQAWINVAMEPLELSGEKFLLRYSEVIPMEADAKNRRITTHSPVTKLDLMPYGWADRWIFARQHPTQKVG
ncbi:MAG: hypothetical protein WCV79_01715 [Candidatus Paceibacterota bacterium]|jgi:hypothetical protein